MKLSLQTNFFSAGRLNRLVALAVFLLLCVHARAASEQRDWAKPFTACYREYTEEGHASDAEYYLNFTDDGFLMLIHRNLLGTTPVYGYSYKYDGKVIQLKGIETFTVDHNGHFHRKFKRPADGTIVPKNVRIATVHAFADFDMMPDYKQAVNNNTLASCTMGLEDSIANAWLLERNGYRLPTNKNFKIDMETGSLIIARVNPENPEQLLMDFGDNAPLSFPLSDFRKVADKEDMRRILEDDASAWVTYWWFLKCQGDSVPVYHDREKEGRPGLYAACALAVPLILSLLMMLGVRGGRIAERFEFKVRAIFGIQLLELVLAGIAFGLGSGSGLAMLALYIAMAILSFFNAAFAIQTLDYLKEQRGIPYPVMPFLKSAGIAIAVFAVETVAIVGLHLTTDSYWVGAIWALPLFVVFLLMMRYYLGKADRSLLPLFPCLAMMMFFTAVAVVLLIIFVVALFVFKFGWSSFWEAGQAPSSAPRSGFSKGDHRCGSCRRYDTAECPLAAHMLTSYDDRTACDSYVP